MRFVSILSIFLSAEDAAPINVSIEGGSPWDFGWEAIAALAGVIAVVVATWLGLKGVKIAEKTVDRARKDFVADRTDRLVEAWAELTQSKVEWTRCIPLMQEVVNARFALGLRMDGPVNLHVDRELIDKAESLRWQSEDIDGLDRAYTTTRMGLDRLVSLSDAVFASIGKGEHGLAFELRRQSERLVSAQEMFLKLDPGTVEWSRGSCSDELCGREAWSDEDDPSTGRLGCADRPHEVCVKCGNPFDLVKPSGEGARLSGRVWEWAESRVGAQWNMHQHERVRTEVIGVLSRWVDQVGADLSSLAVEQYKERISRCDHDVLFAPYFSDQHDRVDFWIGEDGVKSFHRYYSSPGFFPRGRCGKLLAASVGESTATSSIGGMGGLVFDAYAGLESIVRRVIAIGYRHASDLPASSSGEGEKYQDPVTGSAVLRDEELIRELDAFDVSRALWGASLDTPRAYSYARELAREPLESSARWSTSQWGKLVDFFSSVDGPNFGAQQAPPIPSPSKKYMESLQPESMLWLAEALGVDHERIELAIEAARSQRTTEGQRSAVREVLPWNGLIAPLVVENLRAQECSANWSFRASTTRST